MPAKCGSSPRAKVGIDLVGEAVGAGQTHVERPLLLACASPLPDSLPSASSAFQPCARKPVEIGVMAARARRRPEEARPCASGAIGQLVTHLWLLGLGPRLCGSSGFENPSTGTAQSRFRSRS